MYFNEALSMLPVFLVAAVVLTFIVASINGVHSLLFPARNKYGRHMYRHHTGVSVHNKNTAGQRNTSAAKEDFLR